MPTKTEQPNILFLFPDQLRADFLGCYGAKFAKTPNIDWLCNNSLQYTRAISPAPICIAARASMLTGLNCIKTGVFTNDQWLRPDHSECGMPTWPEVLSNAGYHTEGIGKMHFYPWDISEGFDHRVIAEDKRWLEIEDDYMDYLKDHGFQKHHGEENPGYHENKGAACSPIPHEHQVDTWTTNQTISFLKNHNTSKPFACMVGFPGPHCPYDPPEDFSSIFHPDDMPKSLPENEISKHFRNEMIEGAKGSWNKVDYTDFPEEKRKLVKAYYCALIHQIDIGIGRIIETLKEIGQFDNTVIILSSDHGDFVGDHGLTSKSYFLNPAMNIPIMIKLPKGQHQKINEVVSLTDVYSSILSLAGIKDGENSDSKIMHGLPHSSGPREYLFAPSHKGYMVIKGPWKYVRYFSGLKALTNTEEDPHDQNNRINDPHCHEVLLDLQTIMEKNIDSSIKRGHQEKVVERNLKHQDIAFYERGWQRKYPANI